jgi:hypothetical protein
LDGNALYLDKAGSKKTFQSPGGGRGSSQGGNVINDYFQGFQYFSSLSVLHYLQVVLFIKNLNNFHEYLVLFSLKSGKSTWYHPLLKGLYFEMVQWLYEYYISFKKKMQLDLFHLIYPFEFDSVQQYFCHQPVYIL